MEPDLPDVYNSSQSAKHNNTELNPSSTALCEGHFEHNAVVCYNDSPDGRGQDQQQAWT